MEVVQTEKVNSRFPWSPPPPDFVKINVDGAISRDGNRGAVAAVCRDQIGKYLGSSSITLDYVIDVPCLEALACKEGQSLVADLMERKFLISSDSSVVIKDLEDGTGGNHVAILKEVLARKSDFESCMLRYEWRRRNYEADSLAKFSLSLNFGIHVWLLEPHDVVTIPVNIEQ